MSNPRTRLPKVYVVGGGRDYIRMFFNLGLIGAKHVEEADIVCFTGGEDINPSLYGEPSLKETVYNIDRDERDLRAYVAASKRDNPPVLIGICRGAQFLNVMNRGRMWQHVTDHCKNHEITDYVNNTTVEVTSTHHQMMIPGPDALVMAVASVAKEKHAFGAAELRKKDNTDKNDVEVVWYDNTKSLCFQPHPETGHKPTLDYFAQLMEDFVLPVC